MSLAAALDQRHARCGVLEGAPEALLGGAQRLVGLALFGDVALDRDPDGAVLGVLEGGDGRATPDHRPVLAAVAGVVGDLAVAHEAVGDRVVERTGIAEQPRLQDDQRFAAELAGLVAHHLLEGRVDEDDLRVGRADDADALGHVAHDLGAERELLLGLLARGDVGQGADEGGGRAVLALDAGGAREHPGDLAVVGHQPVLDLELAFGGGGRNPLGREAVAVVGVDDLKPLVAGRAAGRRCPQDRGNTGRCRR